jgi:hypothetical protein
MPNDVTPGYLPHRSALTGRRLLFLALLLALAFAAYKLPNSTPIGKSISPTSSTDR